MIGGLLFRYWDGGRRVVVDPGDGTPLGKELHGYPNVHARWARKPEPYAPPVETPTEVLDERDAVPLPLPVVPAPARAAPRPAVPVAWTRLLSRTAGSAAASPAAYGLRAAMAAVPLATVSAGGSVRGIYRPVALLAADPAFTAKLEQRRRNQKAIELALNLLDDDS